jgi:hypothetical protein
MFNKFLILFLFLYSLLGASASSASPWGLPQVLNDQNMKLFFEVGIPWNILDGTANQISGEISLASDADPGSLRADVAVQSLDYKAGISVSGRLVAVWLRENPPTPAKFIISKSTLACTPETFSAESPCKGSVDGKLTIWAKDYNIDVPVEMKRVDKSFILEGMKEIKWGEYGFGDPTSTIANLNPVITLNFSVQLPPPSA